MFDTGQINWDQMSRVCAILPTVEDACEKACAIGDSLDGRRTCDEVIVMLACSTCTSMLLTSNDHDREPFVFCPSLVPPSFLAFLLHRVWSCLVC
jgi:hypothetical protein